MDLPEPFQVGDLDSVRAAIAGGAWVLVAVTDDSEQSRDLARLCEDEAVQGCLDNFSCFCTEAGSALQDTLDIEIPASLSIFADTEEARACWCVEFPGEVDPEDLVQFLDDQASDILYGEEEDEGEDEEHE